MYEDTWSADRLATLHRCVACFKELARGGTRDSGEGCVHGDGFFLLSSLWKYCAPLLKSLLEHYRSGYVFCED